MHVQSCSWRHQMTRTAQVAVVTCRKPHRSAAVAYVSMFQASINGSTDDKLSRPAIRDKKVCDPGTETLCRLALACTWCTWAVQYSYVMQAFKQSGPTLDHPTEQITADSKMLALSFGLHIIETATAPRLLVIKPA